MKPLSHTSGVWSKPQLLGWNTFYICSSSGILNILEMVICCICIHLMTVSCRPAYSMAVGGFVGSSHDIHFYIALNTSLLITAIIFVCFMISQSSVMLAERTIIVLGIWLFSSLLLLITSIFSFLENIIVLKTDSQPVEVLSKFISSILGVLNSILYLINGISSYKSCKRSWFQL